MQSSSEEKMVIREVRLLEERLNHCLFQKTK